MIQAQPGVVKGPRTPARSDKEKALTHSLGDTLNKLIRIQPGDRAQADSHFAEVFEATPDFIFTTDAQGHVLYCNRAVRKILELREDEDIPPLHITDLYSARSRATVLGEGVVSAILDGEWRGEAALVTRAGQEIPVSQVIVAPAGADRLGEFLAMIARDIKEVKQAEDSLREREQFYRGIAEAARIGIWVIDPKNRTCFVNPQMARMLGYSENEMLGMSAIDFVRCNKIAFSQLDRDDSHELLLRRKDGTELWASLSPSALYDAEEQYAGTMAVVREITESRRGLTQA